ncbi:4-hydroxythreonine-4-phosphate dehydrogenase PdxA [Ramlibacter sp. AN1015]|uniref:PdxA family dehydrogenase n=1 Tax=Ramlibacter sp. AN1015 TaxID=3133428 RepID=UPI0030C412A3
MTRVQAGDAGSDAPVIGIAVGDPQGIGPEIAVRAALGVQRTRGVRTLLFADDFVVTAVCDQLGLGPAERAGLQVQHVGALTPSQWQPGQVAAHAGAATVAYVRAGVAAAQAGRIAALAAAPHSETAVNAAGIPFSGYGGLLADLTGTPRDRVFLLLQAQGLRVVHCTLHESVVAAVARITPELVQAAARAGVETLRRMGLREPSVCVLGINPHAGEGGLFGDEDERVTRVAVAALSASGVQVHGPLGADLALSERRHDLYVAMLHDQGHIATKMLSPKGASALVAGLPLLFASVGHGAAFDIAGRGVADAGAMLDTLTLLADAAASNPSAASA